MFLTKMQQHLMCNNNKSLKTVLKTKEIGPFVTETLKRMKEEY